MRTIYFIGLAIMAWIIIRGVIRHYRLSESRKTRSQQAEEKESPEYEHAREARYRDLE